MKGKEEGVPQVLLRMYSRRFARLALPPPPELEAKVRQWAADDELPAQLHLSAPIGPNAAAAFFDCMRRAGVKSLRSVRLWKADIGDEGARLLCELLRESPQLEVLDLLDNAVGALGCEFLARALQGGPKLRRLLLDHNPFGDEGMLQLATGLRSLDTLTELSVAFCGLGPRSLPALQQLLLFHQSRLEVLNAGYNALGAAGCEGCLRALAANSVLKELILRHNHIEDSPALAERLLQALEATASLRKLDLGCNTFTQSTAERVLEQQTRRLQTEVDLGEDFPPAFAQAFADQMQRVAARRPAGKARKAKAKA